MFNISLYLEKFQSIKDPKIFKREIIETLKRVTGYTLGDNEVVYKRGVVTIESNSIIRSEIYQRRAELIEKLSSTCTVSDIR